MGRKYHIRLMSCSPRSGKISVFTDLSTAVERSESAPSLAPIESGGRWPTSVSVTHLIVAHPACTSKDGLDRGVDRFDHPKADVITAIRGRSSGFPPPEQQPAFAAAVRAHHDAGPKELLSPDIIERRHVVSKPVRLSSVRLSPSRSPRGGPSRRAPCRTSALSRDESRRHPGAAAIVALAWHPIPPRTLAPLDGFCSS
jgi:hypothetical protein